MTLPHSIPTIRWLPVVMSMGLAACGGGDDGSGPGSSAIVIPPPPPPAPPAPPPPSSPAPGPTISSIGAPALAVAGASPSTQAAVGGPTFFTQPTLSLSFPLLQSTMVATSDLVADASTMNAGSTIDFAYCTGCRETFSLTVPSLGISRADLNTFGDTPFTAPLDNGRTLLVEEGTWGRNEFASLKFGYWEIGSPFPINYSSYVYGYETPRANLPASGTATYEGRVFGRVFYRNAQGLGEAGFIGGNVTVHVNFATQSISGQLTGIRAAYAGDAFNHEPWNDLVFTASFGASPTQFTGVTSATSTTGSGLALSSSAKGTVAVRFYGAGGRELGLVWTLYDGSKAALGSGGTKN